MLEFLIYFSCLTLLNLFASSADVCNHLYFMFAFILMISNTYFALQFQLHTPRFHIRSLRLDARTSVIRV